MSQSVDKLKELLFQPESEAIAELSKRIEVVFDRAGTVERFRSSVATVLDGALREAEVARHEEVASAIAPLIVKTVKTEIHNSTDDLVEALYPATGRMVKAYVASAIKDLTNEINRKLGANPVMLRINALLTGRSVGELALADSQRLNVEDVFLIRRATGELVARWPEGTPGSNSDHVLGGVLTAINEFTSEAFKTEGSALRQIDLGDARVYLRVSPAFMLAAKCTGSAPVAAEQVFDEEFLSLIDRHHAALDAETQAGALPAQSVPLLRDLSSRLEARITELQPGNGKLNPGVKPLTVLATLIGVPLLAWLAWSIYIDYRIGHVEAVARRVVDASAPMRGYPADLKVSERGRVLTLAGLAPDTAVKSKLIADLRTVLPDVDVRDQLSAVPTASADVRPLLAELKQDQRTFEAELKTANAGQTYVRAHRLVEQTVALLKSSGAQSAAPERAEIVRLAGRAEAIQHALQPGTKPAQSEADSVAQLRALTSELNKLALTGLEPDVAAAVRAASGEPPAMEGPEALVEAAGRATAAANALVGLSAVKHRLEVETAARAAAKQQLDGEIKQLRDQLAALPTPAEPSPREALQQFAASHAIFFGDGTGYRDEKTAGLALDKLAELMSRDDSLVRVVGHTDEAGSPAQNTALGKARAEVVAAALRSRGVAPRRLVTLSRTSVDSNVSPVVGSGSANRRVGFEVGFIGEGPN
jgi:outer membrane protein OmpA-like peptidoglycan-associated protein